MAGSAANAAETASPNCNACFYLNFIGQGSSPPPPPPPLESDLFLCFLFRLLLLLLSSSWLCGALVEGRARQRLRDSRLVGGSHDLVTGEPASRSASTASRLAPSDTATASGVFPSESATSARQRRSSIARSSGGQPCSKPRPRQSLGRRGRCRAPSLPAATRRALPRPCGRRRRR